MAQWKSENENVNIDKNKIYSYDFRRFTRLFEAYCGSSMRKLKNSPLTKSRSTGENGDESDSVKAINLILASSHILCISEKKDRRHDIEENGITFRF